MSSKKSIFFLRSPKHNLTGIETFLKRRDFDVVSVADYKEAVARLIPLNPDYVFLAWDHPQEQVMNLPKLLAQSCTSKIIPYINSTDKIQHRKLQSASLNPKLFPPLSGPGIQRMIAKLEQSAAEAESEAQNADNKKNASAGTSKKSDMIQVRSTFSGENPGADQNPKFENTLDFSDGEQSVDGQEAYKPRTRADQLRDFQTGLMDYYKKKKARSNEGASHTHTHYDAPESTNSAKTTASADTNDITRDKSTDLNRQQTPLTSDGKNSAQQQINLDESIDLFRQSGAFNHEQSGELFKKLKRSFDENIKPELNDILQNFAEEGADREPRSQAQSGANVSTSKPVFPQVESSRAYCLVIQSSAWIGYLLVQSEIEIDVQTLEFVLSKWIYENFGMSNDDTLDLINTSPIFQISMHPVNFPEFSQKVSNLTTEFQFQNKKITFAFFSIDPQYIFLSLHPKHDMIQLGLHELPFEENLEFEVCLYMPENDRFITYSKKQSKIQKIHLDRLKEKSVRAVFTSFENEASVQKFRAQNQMNLRIDQFKAQSSQTTTP